MNAPRNRSRGDDRVRRRTVRQHNAVARDDVGRDDVHRKLGFFQVAIGQMIVDQLAYAVMRNQEVAPPQKTEQRPQRDREYVAPREAAPDGRELQHPFQRGIARIIGAVQRADAGTDHHVGGDAVLGERVHHADLDRAETATAREHEGGRRATGMLWDFQDRNLSPKRRVAARAVGRAYSSGAEGGATLPASSRRGELREQRAGT